MFYVSLCSAWKLLKSKISKERTNFSHLSLFFHLHISGASHHQLSFFRSRNPKKPKKKEERS